MSDSQDTMIEQLWYVQFFEEDHKEFKVRAVSPGLRENSERIGLLLKRYASYTLPPGTGPLTSVRSFDAPISLALIRTEHGERILVQKTYESSPERPRVHIHMLVGLPPEFSPGEAIVLWKSFFWSSNEVTTIKGGDLLAPISFNKLKDIYIASRLKSFPLFIPYGDLKKAKPHLPFVIQSYLMQQASRERQTRMQGGSRILIAAPVAQVTYLISALSRLLPQQLLRDMTFSTYEHDIQNHQSRICGTCLLLNQRESDSNILPLASYETNFALDTYSQGAQSTPGDFLPDLTRASHYANFAAKSFRTEDVDPKLREFLKKMEDISPLTVDTFLDFYSATFGGSGQTRAPVTAKSVAANPDSRSKKDRVEEVKEPEYTETVPRMVVKESRNPDSAEKSLREVVESSKSAESAETLSPEEVREAFKSTESAERLLRKDSARQQMIQMMFADPILLQTVLSSECIIQLQDVRKQSKSLDLLIRDVNARAIKAVQTDNENSFQTMLTILFYISPRTSGSLSWHDLLATLVGEKQYADFIQHHWFVREKLLDVARQVLLLGNARDDQLVMPLLIVAPPDFGKLLAVPSHGMRESASDEATLLRLPAEWNYLATKQFLVAIRSMSLPQEITQYFEQNGEQLRILFKEIAELSHQDRWQILVQFLDKLVNSQYNRIKSILFQILEAHPPQQEADYLLTVVSLDEKEQNELFRIYDTLCIDLFPLSPLFRNITLHCLPTFPLTWERMTSFASMLDELQETQVNALAGDIAEMLDACIDSPLRLGMLFSSLIRLKTTTAITLLSGMAEHIRKAINEIVAAEERKEIAPDSAMRVKARFSAYVQFALCADTVYDNSQTEMLFGVNLLYHLLKDTDKQVFDFITDDAEYWPADLRMQWEREKETLQNAVQVSSPPQESSVSPTTSTAQTESEVAVLTSTEQQQMLAEEKRKIMQRLHDLLAKGKAGKLGAFCLENYVILRTIGRQHLHQDNWHRMQIAYNFYVACKKADAEKSMEAEQAIVSAYQESHSRGDLLNFVGRDYRRFRRAQKRLESLSHGSMRQ